MYIAWQSYICTLPSVIVFKSNNNVIFESNIHFEQPNNGDIMLHFISSA